MTFSAGSALSPDSPDLPSGDVSATGADGWQPDRLLSGYQARVLPLEPDRDGEDPVVATLVRRPRARHCGPRRAVLYVHGFTDYFFQETLADHFRDLGNDFYALDLRKCGRSLLQQHTPHFTTDLRVYDEELGLALDTIADDLGTDASVLVVAHSTGGLITPLWLDRLRRDDPATHRRVRGLALNSPWLDLQGDAVLRSAPATAVIHAVAAVRPLAPVPKNLPSVYGESLHVSAHGEWTYDLSMKPLSGFGVTFGFIDAVRTGQRQVHRGIDAGVPVLVLRSDKTLFTGHYSPAVDVADVVLDVTQIARWSGSLSERVTAVPVADARHDVFLSIPPVRAEAYRALDAWLTDVLGGDDACAGDVSADEPTEESS